MKVPLCTHGNTIETDPVWTFRRGKKKSCLCHEPQFLDNPTDSLFTIPQIGLVPADFTICRQVFEVMQESQILPTTYSVIDSRLTSFAYSFCSDGLSNRNERVYCMTQCLVGKGLDMTSVKDAVSCFDILFLNSPQEIEEN